MLKGPLQLQQQPEDEEEPTAFFFLFFLFIYFILLLFHFIFVCFPFLASLLGILPFFFFLSISFITYLSTTIRYRNSVLPLNLPIDPVVINEPNHFSVFKPPSSPLLPHSEGLTLATER